MNHSDAELLVRSRTEPEAMGVIHARHAPALHAYLTRRVRRGRCASGRRGRRSRPADRAQTLSGYEQELLLLVGWEQLPRLLTEQELAHGESVDADRAAAIREKLWAAVADIKGVTLDGRVTDSLGRPGWAVSLTLDGIGTQTYIVDPSTGALLETRGDADGVEPSNEGGEVVIEAGPSDSAPSPTPEREILRRMQAADRAAR